MIVSKFGSSSTDSNDNSGYNLLTSGAIAPILPASRRFM